MHGLIKIGGGIVLCGLMGAALRFAPVGWVEVLGDYLSHAANLMTFIYSVGGFLVAWIGGSLMTPRKDPVHLPTNYIATALIPWGGLLLVRLPAALLGAEGGANQALVAGGGLALSTILFGAVFWQAARDMAKERALIGRLSPERLRAAFETIVTGLDTSNLLRCSAEATGAGLDLQVVVTSQEDWSLAMQIAGRMRAELPGVLVFDSPRWPARREDARRIRPYPILLFDREDLAGVTTKRATG